MPDSLLGEAQFGADHYRPKSLFPELAATYSNLFYCCNACNRFKGNSWSEDSKYFVPNPVDHSMFAHLRYKQAIVEPISTAGKFTVELLHLNDAASVQYREDVLHSIDVNEKFLSDMALAERAIERKYKNGAVSMAERDDALRQVDVLKQKTLRVLDRFRGIFKES